MFADRTMEYDLMRKNEPHREQGYEPEPVVSNQPQQFGEIVLLLLDTVVKLVRALAFCVES